MRKIFCVKVAQRRLQPYNNDVNRYTVFPFDRVYLASWDATQIAKRLFRYYFSLKLDTTLIRALTQLHSSNCLCTVTDFPVKRPVTKPKFAPDRKLFENLVRDYELDTMIVPTYAQTRVNPADKTTHTFIGYTFTRTISDLRANRLVQMPRITLHTPHRNIPVACSVCSQAFEFYANNCTPGTPDCRSKLDLRLTSKIYQEGDYYDDRVQ